MRDADLEGALRRLLEDERRALMNGEFELFGAIAQRKLYLIAALQKRPSPASAEVMKDLRAQAVRNGQLFAAALSGLRNVRDRIAHLVNGGAELKTYGADGARAALASTPGKVQRRR